MKYLIDVDGVVANLLKYTLECLKKDIDLPAPEPEEVEILDFFRSEDSPLNEIQRRYVRSLMGAPGTALQFELLPGAQEAINKIVDHYHEVVWVTAPYYNSRTWPSDRMSWLHKNFPNVPRDNIIITHNKYHVPGDIFIDDNPHKVLAWKKHNSGRALLFDQPYNRSFTNLERFDWSMLDDLLGNRM